MSDDDDSTLPPAVKHWMYLTCLRDFYDNDELADHIRQMPATPWSESSWIEVHYRERDIHLFIPFHL